ncbi:T9SS type A sorting domain-containing protein [bacterium]|nr:T9SS type A sorting domain-containing protein [bacterium]
MKKIIIFWGILYCICFCNIPLFSQNKIVFHYPLKIGDVWQYRDFPPGAPLTRKVIGDTLMPNGKGYRIIQEYSPLYGTKLFFQRINEDSTAVFKFYMRRDTTNQLVPDEFLLYKLDIKVGDSWKFLISPSASDSATFQVTQIADTTLWSKRFKFAFIFSPEAFALEFILVDSIGIFYEGFEGGRLLELQGAIINNKRFGTLTSVRSFENHSSENFISSFTHYPSPFNHSTTIEYKLNTSGRVRISIFNLIGERVKILDDSFQTSGLYRKQWFGKNESGEFVASGIYIYTIEVNNTIIAKDTITFLK